MSDAPQLIERIAAGLSGAAVHRVQVGRPLVTLSYAQSLDGCIAAVPGQRLALSSREALVLTHELRARHEAILVGVGTVLADNPRLTVRLVEGRNPQPVVVDSWLRLSRDCYLLREGPVSPWIASGPAADPERRAAIEATGARILTVPASASGELNLPALLRELAARGVASLLVEGGARVISSFLRARLVDQIVLTIAPRLVGGVHAVQGPLLLNGRAPRLSGVDYAEIGGDIVVRADIVWGER
jgi:3,4-dihydroxy 2-butanone 4-phosphate synthase/GTP cyclohydrolase II